MTAAVTDLDRLRPVSVTPPNTETEMATNRRTETTSVPGVYRRGSKYIYAYRANGRQRWGTADSFDDARRKKRQADADVDRGDFADLLTVGFGEYARDWI